MTKSPYVAVGLRPCPTCNGSGLTTHRGPLKWCTNCRGVGKVPGDKLCIEQMKGKK